MRIIIFGGAGYLGSHVAHALRGMDQQVVVFDNLTYADEFHLPAEFVFGDVTDRTAVELAAFDAGAIVWLAAIVGDAACAADPARAIAINQESVKTAAGLGKPIVFTSSCSVYGINGGGEADEDAPLCPQSLYAETKIKAEQYLQGTHAAILRLGTLHGTSERMRFDLVVNAMTRDAVERGVFHVYGGHQRRPLLAVQDAADFIARQAVAGVPKPGTYNVASENLTIHEVGECVEALTGAALHRADSHSQDKRDYVVSTDRARRIGFEPVDSVEGSVHAISDLIRSRRIKDPYAPRYTNALRFT